MNTQKESLTTEDWTIAGGSPTRASGAPKVDVMAVGSVGSGSGTVAPIPPVAPAQPIEICVKMASDMKIASADMKEAAIALRNASANIADLANELKEVTQCMKRASTNGRKSSRRAAEMSAEFKRSAESLKETVTSLEKFRSSLGR